MTSEETVSEEARRETERPSPWKTFTVCSNSMCKFESLARWQDASPPLGGGGGDHNVLHYYCAIAHVCASVCVFAHVFMCVCVCVCMRHISDSVCTCISDTKNGCLSFILGSNRQTKIYCQFCVFAHTPNNATFYYFFTLRHNAAEYRSVIPEQQGEVLIRPITPAPFLQQQNKKYIEQSKHAHAASFRSPPYTPTDFYNGREEVGGTEGDEGYFEQPAYVLAIYCEIRVQIESSASS